MKREAIPLLSNSGQQILEQYGVYLHKHQDMAPSTLRNYLSDVRQFVAWCEQAWKAWANEEETPEEIEGKVAAEFSLLRVSTPTITRYRAYLQTDLRLKPTTVNRYLMRLRRFFDWAKDAGLVSRDPMGMVKLVPEGHTAPRQLSDQEEEDLLAAVTADGNLCDHTLVVVMLHTGLRAGEICLLRRDQITLHKRSGSLLVVGKGNKQREVPLNATARQVLREYIATLPVEAEQQYLFASKQSGQCLTERGLGHLIAKYARKARLLAVSPHDLRHRFAYRMAKSVPLHRLAQILGHDSLDTTLIYITGTRSDLQIEVEKIAWT